MIGILRGIGKWLFRRVLKKVLKSVADGAKTEFLELCEWFGEEMSKLGNKQAEKVGLNFNVDVEPVLYEGLDRVEVGLKKN